MESKVGEKRSLHDLIQLKSTSKRGVGTLFNVKGDQSWVAIATHTDLLLEIGLLPSSSPNVAAQEESVE